MKLRFAVWYLYFMSLLWAGFGVAWFFQNSAYRYFYGLAGLACGVSLALLGRFLSMRRRWAWQTAAAFAIASIVVTFFDQIGWIDWVFLFLAAGLLATLLVSRPEAAARPPLGSGQQIQK